MLDTISRNWWVVLVRGLVAILFGVLAIIWPGATLYSLTLLFGAYALVDGIFAVISGLRSTGTNARWWVVVLEGLAGIAVGLLTFFYPGITTLVLLYFIAAWAIITGVLEIVAAIRLRHEITNEWMMALSGVLSIVFGIVLFLFPGEGALGLVWVIGIYAILFGVLMIILAFRLRGMQRDTTTAGSPRT